MSGTIAFNQWSLASFTVFAIVGAFFPALVTFLNFEANKRIGPSLTGALGNLSPAFAVAFAVIALGETPNAPQVIAIAAVCIGVALLFLKPDATASHITAWMLALPLAAALIRGLVQPAIKYALIGWPSPFAAVTTGYLVSACVMAIYARISGLNRKDFNTSGVVWFMAIAVANGAAVFLLYAALARGPVTIVTPIVACYPVIVLMMNAVLREDRNVTARTITGVSITVAGIAMLLFYQ